MSSVQPAPRRVRPMAGVTTQPMMAAVTATIPPEREGEFLAAFRELSSADKPEGLERSELLRATDGRWVIQSLWRDLEAMAAARQGVKEAGRPRAVGQPRGYSHPRAVHRRARRLTLRLHDVAAPR